MKALFLTPLLALLFAGGSLTAQNWPDEYLGLPGDNLNLFAVMNLFQDSETLEGFERSLNDPEQMINNLDLNGDNYVDYIMVHNYVYDDIHNIVLRVALNEHEMQDVAVFTVQRFGDGSVQIQLIGDEALYGPNYIVEPYYAETPNPGYRGNVTQQSQENVTVVHTTYYEVASWPVVTYIYRPGYRGYRSSWYWGYNPYWWSPWNPHYWHFYYGYHYHWHSHYYAHYRPWRYYRCGYYHNVYYTNVRHHSPQVVVMVNNGSYNNTYSRPESRKDGEVLYAQRNPRGSTVPGTRGSGREDAQGRSDVNERSASRETNANSRSTTPARNVESSTRESSGRAPEAREANTPARNTSAAPARNTSQPRNTAPARNVNQSSNQRSTTAPSSGNVNQRNTAPAAPSRNVNQPSQSRSNRETQTAPARQNNNTQNSGVRTQSSSQRNQQSSSSSNSSNRKNNTSRAPRGSGR